MRHACACRGESGRFVKSLCERFAERQRTSRSSDCATGRTSFRPSERRRNREIESERDRFLSRPRRVSVDRRKTTPWPLNVARGRENRFLEVVTPLDSLYHCLSFLLLLFLCFSLSELRSAGTLGASTCSEFTFAINAQIRRAMLINDSRQKFRRWS